MLSTETSKPPTTLLLAVTHLYYQQLKLSLSFEMLYTIIITEQVKYVRTIYMLSMFVHAFLRCDVTAVCSFR